MPLESDCGTSTKIIKSSSIWGLESDCFFSFVLCTIQAPVLSPLHSCFTLSTLTILYSISGDALYALKTSLKATGNQLKDWNINQVNPCTWPNVGCDANNNVVSV